MKTLTAILLTCSFCLTGRAQEFDNPIGLGSIGLGSLEPFELLSTKGHDADFSLTGCIVGISVVCAGTVIVVWLRDFCQKHLGTNQPARTNTHKVQRSENLTDWKLAGAMTWNDSDSAWEYRETNSVSEPFHFYRITNYFGQ